MKWKKNLKKQVKWSSFAYGTLAVLWGIVILYVSVMPEPEQALPRAVSTLQINDKVGHFVSYAIFAMLLYAALRRVNGSWEKRQVLLIAFAISALYGLSMECFQYFLPFRSAESLDVVANVVGSMFALLVWDQTVPNRTASKLQAQALLHRGSKR